MTEEPRALSPLHTTLQLQVLPHTQLNIPAHTVGLLLHHTCLSLTRVTPAVFMMFLHL